MTRICEIQWVDAQGEPTPDTNPAIQRVRVVEHVQKIGGRAITFKQSPWYCICAEHSKRLNDPGMHIWECADL